MEYEIMILIALLSYGIGNINPAILIGKLTRGIDIREYNSKNAGTSNVVMTVGYRWGIFAGIIDILKGFIPVLIVRLIFRENDVYWLISGFSAIMGHIYPLYYKFKGGKGTATFGGVLFAISPLMALGLLIVFIIVLYYTDYIALSTLSAIVITPIAMYFLGFHYMSIFIITVYSFVSFYKHFENYKRIFKGEELGLRRFNRNKDKVRAK